MVGLSLVFFFLSHYPSLFKNMLNRFPPYNTVTKMINSFHILTEKQTARFRLLPGFSSFFCEYRDWIEEDIGVWPRFAAGIATQTGHQ